MKNAQRISWLLILILFWSVVFAEGGLALSQEAQICMDLGMLKGEAQGVTQPYLDKPCTRLQGAIMLLRLMQKETEAAGYSGGDGFIDTTNMQWVEGRNMMGYLKANPKLGFGGYPDGSFRPDDLFTVQQYYKVLLEVLGYTYSADFTWDTVFDTASSVGFTALNPGKTLTMEDVAKATVQSLKIKVKGQNQTLGARLTSQGVINESLASRYGLLTPVATAATNVLQAKDVRYLGAFRLPNESEEYGWMWSGEALCFNPKGNGGQGSLIGTGHNHLTEVSEITIPEPVNTRNLGSMPMARTLQPFTDIKGSLYSDRYIEIPRVGLEVLGDRLYFCWGDHMQDEITLPTHGYTALNFSSSQPVGLWRIGGARYNYSTNDYLFKVPKTWADQNAPGFDLVTGRFRDGGWGGMGPSLIMIKSSDFVAGQTVSTKEIVKYTDVNDFSGARHTLDNYSEADSWAGGAWVDAPAGSAVILAGTHGYGQSWYGFANGVVYPTDGNGPFPEVPPYPYDQRGWWNSDFRAAMMFYSPSDLAKVAKGQMNAYAVQPYLTMDLTPYMLVSRAKTDMQYLGATAYDDVRHRLYVMEILADEDKPVIHVFEIGE